MTIYTSYTYNSGGYGDFIRSFLAVFVYCKQNGMDHELYIPNHPLNQCFKDSEHIQSIQCTEHIEYVQKSLQTGYYINCNSSDLFNLLEQCKIHNYSVIIISNKFDFISFDTLKLYVNDFKNFIKLSEPVLNRIDNLLNSINNTAYTSIHIRFGDRFMECNSQCIFDDIRVDPSNQILFDKLETSIKYLKDTYNLPICLFTDVQSFKTVLCERYDLIGFKTEIHHTASTSDKDDAFIDSVVEFELLGKSKAIIKFANTGFAFWSAFINNVPLLICGNEIDDFSITPFNDLKY